MSRFSSRARRRGPGHATVVAYIALFVALGGSAYAAVSLPANSVGTPQLRRGAVTLAKVSAGARAALRGSTGPAGRQGAQGVQGVPGVQGPPGAPGSVSGKAGGDLAGSYPNPSIAAGAITTGDLAAGSVNGTAIASAAVSYGKIAAGSVDASKFTDMPVERISLNGSSQALLYPAGGAPASVPLDQVSFNDLFSIAPTWYGTIGVAISGVYQVDAGADWDTNESDGDRFAGIAVNQNCCLAGQWVPATGHTIENVSDLVDLKAGDDISLDVMQNSSGHTGLQNTNGSFLAAHWVAPYVP